MHTGMQPSFHHFAVSHAMKATVPSPLMSAACSCDELVLPLPAAGEREVLAPSAGHLAGKVLLAGRERQLPAFRRASAHVKQVGRQAGVHVLKRLQCANMASQHAQHMVYAGAAALSDEL